MKFNEIEFAAELMSNSKYTVVFTGAGISLKSGIPTFRGDGGLWQKYDPAILDIENYKNNPEECWPIIKSLFYEYFGKAKPNEAHYKIAEFEKRGLIKSVITQNIDNLHQIAGSANIVEFHGNSREFVCTHCGKKYFSKNINLDDKPPLCSSCYHLLKPDFIFFGEGIPSDAYHTAFSEIDKAELLLIVGTTGEVMPASLIPLELRKEAKVIEINPCKSKFTDTITDIFIQGKAEEVLPKLFDFVYGKLV